MAEKNIAIGGYDVSAFLAHQAVEKLLKCIFILEKKEVPKTHKLDRLVQLLSISTEIADKIFDLTEDSTLSRYPDVSVELPYIQYTKEIATEKVAITKEVFDALQDRCMDLED